MTTRKKNGHVVILSPPVTASHGRPLSTVRAIRTRPEANEPAARYAVAQVERALAKATKQTAKERTATRRAERARAALLREVDGLAQVEAVNRALVADGGASLRAAAKAHPNAREYAIQAALTLVRLVREHDVSTSAGLAYLGSAAAWLAHERLLHDRAFAAEHPDAGLLKMASIAATSARHALSWALHTEKEARDARPAPMPWLLNAPVAPPGAPEPEDEHEPAQDHEDASADDGEPVRDPDEAPEADEHGEYENRFSYSEPERVPHASEPPAGAVPGVGRTRAAASLAPRTHDAQGRLIVPTGGPDAAALREMKKRGIDTSRWEKP